MIFDNTKQFATNYLHILLIVIPNRILSVVNLCISKVQIPLSPMNIFMKGRYVCGTLSSYRTLTGHLLEYIDEPNCSNVCLNETNNKPIIYSTFYL